MIDRPPEVTRRRFILGTMATAAWGALGVLPSVAGAEALRDYADEKGILFGSAVSPDVFRDTQYADLISSQCRITVPENALKWASLSTSPGEYDFSNADKL